jgi:hypothetical protein
MLHDLSLPASGPAPGMLECCWARGRAYVLGSCPFIADTAFLVGPRSVRLALPQYSFDLGEVSVGRDGQGDDVQAGTVTFARRA